MRRNRRKTEKNLPASLFIFLNSVTFTYIGNHKDIIRGVILKQRQKTDSAPEEFTRVRIPQKSANEVLATVESLVGANKIRVRCMDGVVRLARIPGKIKKRIWMMEGDIVIVVPWSFQNEKADIVWKYSGPQVNWLQRKGFLKS